MRAATVSVAVRRREAKGVASEEARAWTGGGTLKSASTESLGVSAEVEEEEERYMEVRWRKKERESGALKKGRET